MGRLCGCEECLRIDPDWGCDLPAMEGYDLCPSCDDGDHI